MGTSQADTRRRLRRQGRTTHGRYASVWHSPAVAARLLILGALLVATACGDLDESQSETAQVAMTTSTAPIVDSEVPRTSTTELPFTTEIESCVEVAKFHVYTGNEIWGAVWAMNGESADGLRRHCTELATNNPDELTQIALEWTSIRALLDTPTTTDAPATTPPTTQPPQASPSLVKSCVDYIDWFQMVGDSDAREIWVESGSSRAGLQPLCNLYALSRPEDVRSMQRELDDINRYLEKASQPAPPPVAQSPSCNPNYSGCVPNASDVDCAGGSGNGPAYTGRVQVIGVDVYGLDGDGDGIGCE